MQAAVVGSVVDDHLGAVVDGDLSSERCVMSRDSSVPSRKTMFGRWRSSISAGPWRNSALSTTDPCVRMFSMKTVSANLYARP